MQGLQGYSENLKVPPAPAQKINSKNAKVQNLFFLERCRKFEKDHDSPANPATTGPRASPSTCP